MSYPNKHTPGPWHVLSGNHLTVETVHNPRLQLSGTLVATVHGRQNGWQDARLIAAAPEMYEVLRSLEDDAGPTPDFMWWQKVQDVIAKVEGTTHE